MKMKQGKVYTVKVVIRGDFGDWHNEIAGNGKKYKAIWFKGSPYNCFMLKKRQLANGTYGNLVYEKYCRVICGSPTHGLQRVRSIRCL